MDGDSAGPKGTGLLSQQYPCSENIEVQVTFDRRTFSLSVRDDGKGMSSKVLDSGVLNHFGLLGMRERVERVRGRLRNFSAWGAGTEVALTLKGRVAYVSTRPPLLEILKELWKGIA